MGSYYPEFHNHRTLGQAWGVGSQDNPDHITVHFCSVSCWVSVLPGKRVHLVPTTIPTSCPVRGPDTEIGSCQRFEAHETSRMPSSSLPSPSFLLFSEPQHPCSPNRLHRPSADPPPERETYSAPLHYLNLKRRRRKGGEEEEGDKGRGWGRRGWSGRGEEEVKKRGKGEERRKLGETCLVGKRKGGPSWAQSRSPQCAVAALRFQPKAPASILWLNVITGKTVGRISGFVIKGDSTKPVITRCWGSVPRSWAAGTMRAHQGRLEGGRKPIPILAREPKWRLLPWPWRRDNEWAWTGSLAVSGVRL